jgi:hypothetical protein
VLREFFAAEEMTRWIPLPGSPNGRKKLLGSAGMENGKGKTTVAGKTIVLAAVEMLPGQ